MTERPRPRCPFCDASWTDSMLDLFDSYAVEGGCACCGDTDSAHEHADSPLPTEDVRCAACGKPIYRAPAPGLGLS